MTSYLRLKFHNSWARFVSADEAIKDPSAASLISALCQNYLAQGDMQTAEGAAMEAVRLYELALPVFEDKVLQDRRDMAAQASLAWCYFGRSAAWRMRSNLQEVKTDANTGVGNPAGESAGSDMTNLDGLELLSQVIHSLPPAERRTVDDLYGKALLREPGLQQNLRLWKTAEAIAASMIRDQGPNVLKFASGFGSEAATQPNELGKAAVVYPPLLEAQQKAELDDDETRALVCLLCRQLMNFVKQNDAEDTSKLSRLWMGAEADVTARQAADQFLMLAEGDRRANAESAYGRACLSAIRGDGGEAAALLSQADTVAGEGTFAYRNRAVLDKDFDGVRLAPGFVDLTGWPPAGEAPVVAEGNLETRAAAAAG